MNKRHEKYYDNIPFVMFLNKWRIHIKEIQYVITLCKMDISSCIKIQCIKPNFHLFLSLYTMIHLF